MTFSTSKIDRRTLLRSLSALTALALAIVLAPRFTGNDEPESSTTIRASMADATQLEVGSEVRSAGVLVGEVTDIQLKDNQAEMTIEVEEGVLPLHRDASLTLKPINLLGEVYVSLDPGNAGTSFMERAYIPVSQTHVSTTLQDVLNTLDSPKAAQLAAVVSTLGEGLSGNGANVQAAIKALAPALRDAGALGDVLAQQNAVLANLIETVDPVAAALADDSGATLDALVEATEATLAAVSRQQAALGQTLQELPATLVSAQRTLGELGGVSEQALPTLRSLRPLTGDLSDVVEELDRFADAADPALASLGPVLDRADQLLDQAAPIVEQLRRAGPDLAAAAANLRPVSRELLQENLYGVMEFVRKWALSTNGRDSLSHYFRGVVYLTPESLETIANSLIPPQLGVTGEGQDDNPIELPDLGLPLPDLPGTVDGTIDGLGGLLGGLSGRGRQGDDGTTSTGGATGALGLTNTQEHALLGQLLGSGE